MEEKDNQRMQEIQNKRKDLESVKEQQQNYKEVLP